MSVVEEKQGSGTVESGALGHSQRNEKSSVEVLLDHTFTMSAVHEIVLYLSGEGTGTHPLQTAEKGLVKTYSGNSLAFLYSSYVFDHILKLPMS